MTGLVWCGLVLTSLHRYAHSLIIAVLYINTHSTSLAQSYAGSMEFEQRVFVILFISTNLDFTLWNYLQTCGQIWRLAGVCLVRGAKGEMSASGWLLAGRGTLCMEGRCAGQ